MLYRLVIGDTIATKPTLGSNVEEINFHNMKLVMWDIAGQQNLRNSWVNYYLDTSVVIYMIDSTDRDKLVTSKAELLKMLQHDRLNKAKLLVLANKSDIKGSMSSSEVSEFLGLDNLKDRDWHINSCCALTGEGLEESMNWIGSHL